MRFANFALPAGMGLPAMAFFALAGAYLFYRWIRAEEGQASFHDADNLHPHLIYDPASGVYRPDSLTLASRRM